MLAWIKYFNSALKRGWKNTNGNCLSRTIENALLAVPGYSVWSPVHTTLTIISNILLSFISKLLYIENLNWIRIDILIYPVSLSWLSLKQHLGCQPWSIRYKCFLYRLDGAGFHARMSKSYYFAWICFLSCIIYKAEVFYIVHIKITVL